jgi:hypothetical protein
MSQREWDKGCTYHHSWRIWETRKTSGGSADPWGWRITLVYLVPYHESAVDVVQRLCGRSPVCMSTISLGDLPHNCSCTWCCLQTKRENKRWTLLVREPMSLYSNSNTNSPWDLAQTRLTCLGLPSHLNQAQWLTPFGFENSCKG